MALQVLLYNCETLEQSFLLKFEQVLGLETVAFPTQVLRGNIGLEFLTGKNY